MTRIRQLRYSACVCLEHRRSFRRHRQYRPKLAQMTASTWRYLPRSPTLSGRTCVSRSRSSGVAITAHRRRPVCGRRRASASASHGFVCDQLHIQLVVPACPRTSTTDGFRERGDTNLGAQGGSRTQDGPHTRLHSQLRAFLQWGDAWKPWFRWLGIRHRWTRPRLNCASSALACEHGTWELAHNTDRGRVHGTTGTDTTSSTRAATTSARRRRERGDHSPTSAPMASNSRSPRASLSQLPSGGARTSRHDVDAPRTRV